MSSRADANSAIPSTTNLWLGLSGLLLLGFFVLSLLPIMLLNGGWVNHMLTPVGSYLPMFQLIWQEQPLGALQFILTKSFIAFAHRDMQTGLDIWTLEYDALTLGVYLIAALLGGRLLLPLVRNGRGERGMLVGLTGMAGLVLAFTYMTSIDHCAGPTWIGFVIAYGLGADGFELSWWWQGVLGTISLGLLGYGLWQQRHKKPLLQERL